MTLFPEAQKKAQAEIDAVVGTDRLPVLEDRERLPYVDALVKEVLRFNPVAPLSEPISSDSILSSEPSTGPVGALQVFPTVSWKKISMRVITYLRVP